MPTNPHRHTVITPIAGNPKSSTLLMSILIEELCIGGIYRWKATRRDKLECELELFHRAWGKGEPQ